MKRIYNFHFFLFLLVVACSDGRNKQAEINYLGQRPPGKTAKLFAAGVVSTDAMEHSAPAFSPDGTVVLWTVVPAGFSKPAYILEMNYDHQKWSAPHRVSFNDSTAQMTTIRRSHPMAIRFISALEENYLKAIRKMVT